MNVTESGISGGFPLCKFSRFLGKIKQLLCAIFLVGKLNKTPVRSKPYEKYNDTENLFPQKCISYDPERRAEVLEATTYCLRSHMLKASLSHPTHAKEHIVRFHGSAAFSQPFKFPILIYISIFTATPPPPIPH